MNILVTNDDGWDSLGIALLAKAAEAFGQVTVVAPADHQSGISHQLTLNRPLELLERGPRRYSLGGTPADCVRIALTQLEIRFDLVLSGINDGANLGADVYVSGTVAAAREARLFGVRAIAFSQYRKRYLEPFDWSRSGEMVTRILERQLSLEDGSMLTNINFPDCSHPVEQVPVVQCELDPNPLPSDYEKSDRGFVYVSRYSHRQNDAGRDVQVCFSDRIAITELA